MGLEDTVEDMLSDDYLRRYRAELNQLRIRIDRLEEIIEEAGQGRLAYRSNCPMQLLVSQLEKMKEYRDALELRAAYEDIQI